MQIVTHNETELVLRSGSIRTKALVAAVCLIFGIGLLILMVVTSDIYLFILCLLAFAGFANSVFSLVIRTFVLDKGAGYLVRATWAPRTLWRPHVTRYPLHDVAAVSLGWGDERESCSFSVELKSGETIEFERLIFGAEENAPEEVRQISQLVQVAELVNDFLRVPLNSSKEFRMYQLPLVASAQTPPKCPGCGGYLPLNDQRANQVTCNYCGMAVPIKWTPANPATHSWTQ